MKVQVKLFASLREAAGTDEVALELPDGATAADALARIREDHPDVGDRSDLVFARNREVVDAGTELADGDEVALMPPVSGGAVETGLVEDAASLDEALEQVRTEATGAVVTFTGVVRGENRGRDVEKLEYDVYGPMAEDSLMDLVARARERFAIEDAVVVHRVGTFGVGEPVVAIAVAAPHRDEAFEACRWLIDTLKDETPIWKKEHTTDGARWVEPRA